MLSMSLKGVRGLPQTPLREERGVWYIQVQHGAQRHRTRSLELAHSDERDLVVGASDGGAQWDEEVEIFDKESQETVEISLVFEGEPAVGCTTNRAPRFGWGSYCRRRRRHANATVEMRIFRSHPEESVTAWLPLRSVSSNCDRDFGAIQVRFTYSDDSMAQGYLYALFCGLVPLYLPEFWTDGIPVERGNGATKATDIPDHRPSASSTSLKKTEPFVAPGKGDISAPVADLPQLASKMAESPEESRRTVRFEDQFCVDAGAA